MFKNHFKIVYLYLQISRKSIRKLKIIIKLLLYQPMLSLIEGIFMESASPEQTAAVKAFTGFRSSPLIRKYPTSILRDYLRVR